MFIVSSYDWRRRCAGRLEPDRVECSKWIGNRVALSSSSCNPVTEPRSFILVSCIKSCDKYLQLLMGKEGGWDRSRNIAIKQNNSGMMGSNARALGFQCVQPAPARI